jgi:hypothetical protein
MFSDRQNNLKPKPAPTYTLSLVIAQPLSFRIAQKPPSFDSLTLKESLLVLHLTASKHPPHIVSPAPPLLEYQATI